MVQTSVGLPAPCFHVAKYSCIGNARKSSCILSRVSHTHTTTRHTTQPRTPQHRRRWLVCCHFCCCSARVGEIYPHLCPSAAHNSTRWPQCGVSMMTFCQLTAALALALATVEETQCLNGLEDEMKENARRVKLTPCSRKKRGISMYVWLGAGAGG